MLWDKFSDFLVGFLLNLICWYFEGSTCEEYFDFRWKCEIRNLFRVEWVVDLLAHHLLQRLAVDNLCLLEFSWSLALVQEVAWVGNPLTGASRSTDFRATTIVHLGINNECAACERARKGENSHEKAVDLQIWKFRSSLPRNLQSLIIIQQIYQ